MQLHVAGGFALLCAISAAVMGFRVWKARGGITKFQLNRAPQHGLATTVGE